MMKHESKLPALMALTVFTLFALFLLLVLLSGADVYRDLTILGESDHLRRTAARYLTTRVRQAEAVRAGNFRGSQALILEETAGSETYLTRVYCHDGWLRELYTAESGSFSPEDGEKILEAEALALSEGPGLLQAELALCEGDVITLWLHIPAGQEVAP